MSEAEKENGKFGTKNFFVFIVVALECVYYLVYLRLFVCVYSNKAFSLLLILHRVHNGSLCTQSRWQNVIFPLRKLSSRSVVTPFLTRSLFFQFWIIHVSSCSRYKKCMYSTAWYGVDCLSFFFSLIFLHSNTLSTVLRFCFFLCQISDSPSKSTRLL